MDKFDDEVQEIIEQKIAKVNGEIAHKKYLKGKLLGKGGFAKCYQGTNMDNKLKYAIKVIDKVSLQKSRAKQKLLSQIKIHKTLHQKHIVQFDSVFQDQKNVYIILQLCTNKTLSQMVKKRKKLTMKEVRFFMLQIVSSLQYMHSNRVIHRDLKMGNIFLNQNMDLKVGDFGLATKTMCGTPNYIAPQIVQGAVGHSYQVDIWSTGVICYALMFGRPPFETNEVKMTYKKIKNCDYSFPNINVSEQGKDFIRKILILDPKQRMTVKQMYEHPFLKCDDIPKNIPVEALTTIPIFKNNRQQGTKQSLTRIKSSQKLKPEDFGKKKLQLNLNANTTNKIQLDGMHSPRNVFNSDLQQGGKQGNLGANVDKEQQHKIHLLAYVDYSKKYGLGYLINNKFYGVYFNDQTLMSTDSETKNVYLLANPAAKHEKIDQYAHDSLPKDRDFQKKYMLLQRFIVHLNDQVAKLPQEKVFYHKDDKFVYIKQWLKTRHAIMFGLSNKLFQVNFYDSSQILLNTQKKTVLFHSKRNQTTYQSLTNALQLTDSEIARRIKYTKQILNSIKQKKEDKVQEIQFSAR